jgi:hypothetical protein
MSGLTMSQGGDIAAAEPISAEFRGDNGAASDVSPGAIDVIVRWGDWVLAAHELAPPRPFFLGEQNADVLVSSDVLGAQRLPLVLVRWDGAVRIVVPKGGRILLGTQTKRMSAARLLARGLGQASPTIHEAAEVPFLPGQTATVFVGTMAIDLCFSTAAPRFERQSIVEKRALLAQIASFLAHMSVLCILAFVIEPPGIDPRFGMTAEQLNEFQRRIWRLEREERRMRWLLTVEEELAQSYAQRGMVIDNPTTAKAWLNSLEAESSRWSSELDADAERRESTNRSNAPLLGLLYDWPEPPPPPKRKPTIEEVLKAPEVVLPEEQTGRNQKRFRGPRVRMGATSVSGRMPQEVIQRIVRQNFGRFRLCYENGLRLNPNLQGRVAVRFVIGRDGAVSNVGNGGSDLPDSGVVRCVVKQFINLEFPRPESGIVTVVFPIMFSPPDY